MRALRIDPSHGDWCMNGQDVTMWVDANSLAIGVFNWAGPDRWHTTIPSDKCFGINVHPLEAKNIMSCEMDKSFLWTDADIFTIFSVTNSSDAPSIHARKL